MSDDEKDDLSNITVILSTMQPMVKKMHDELIGDYDKIGLLERTRNLEESEGERKSQSKYIYTASVGAVIAAIVSWFKDHIS